MSAKAGFFCTVLATLLLIGVGHAEDPPNYSTTPQDTAPAEPPAEDPGAGAPPIAPSPWLTYVRPCCCGPVGGSGPIRSELYIRSGTAVPLNVGNSSFFPRVLRDGWEIQGGGRSLFFNPDGDRAWTVDLGVGHIHNDHSRSDLTYPLKDNVPTIPVAVRNMNRTSATLAFGREWWLMASTAQNWAWRFGVDGGGRWGTARLDLFDASQGSNFRRVNDVYSGVFAALHTDFELPRGAFTFIVGFRAQWSYNWMDFIQTPGINGDIQDVSLLGNFGMRF